MWIDVKDLKEILDKEYVGDEKVLSFKIKIKKDRSTKVIQNHSYPKDEE